MKPTIEKTILVTGGAKGLGRSIALELAKRKFPVVIHYRKSRSEAEEVVKQCQAFGSQAEMIYGDFSNLESLKKFCEEYFSQYPKTQGLVNNVGNYAVGNVQSTDEEQWLSLFQTNLHAPFFLIKALLPSLKQNKGKIVNIGTCGVKSLKSNTYATAYTASKSALLFLTTSLAKELAPDGVTVNMVSPGYLENSVDLPPILPMGRTAAFEEVASIVGLLFQSPYITGQNIEVAGGVGL